MMSTFVTAQISLKYLHLAYNSIRVVPDQLRALTCLTYLNLSTNHIASIPNIGTLNKLEYPKYVLSNIAYYLDTLIYTATY
jgi:Leucine-rich repeat (LRR) protein